jgi:hypothetical protein
MVMWIRKVSPRGVLGVRGLDVASPSPGGEVAGGVVEDSTGVLVAGPDRPASLGGLLVPHATTARTAVVVTTAAVIRRTVCIGSPSGLEVES